MSVILHERGKSIPACNQAFPGPRYMPSMSCLLLEALGSSTLAIYDLTQTIFHPRHYRAAQYTTSIQVKKSPQNQVARHTQGLPTVPQNDPGGLNFKGLASKYLLLMTLPPADDEKIKKNRTSGTPTSEKTSDSAFSSKVRSTKVKLEIRNSKNWLGYGPASEWRCMHDPPMAIQFAIFFLKTFFQGYIYTRGLANWGNFDSLYLSRVESIPKFSKKKIVVVFD